MNLNKPSRSLEERIDIRPMSLYVNTINAINIDHPGYGHPNKETQKTRFIDDIKIQIYNIIKKLVTVNSMEFKEEESMTIEKYMAVAQAKFMFKLMTDIRWHTKVGLSYENYQKNLETERIRFKAKMYDILILGNYT